MRCLLITGAGGGSHTFTPLRPCPTLPQNMTSTNRGTFPLRRNVKHIHLLGFVSLEKAPRIPLESGPGKDGGSDPRTSFYNKFKEEVAEHDDDIQKKHDEDLNTTLIFVSFFPLNESTWLTRLAVWPVFCRDLRLHNSHPVGTQTRLRSNE